MKRKNNVEKKHPVLSFSLYLLGYRCVMAKGDGLSILNLLLKSSLPLYRYRDGRIFLREADYVRLKRIIDVHSTSVSEPRGLPAIVRKALTHPGLILGLILSVALAVLLSMTVWEVRTECEEGIDSDKLLLDLSQCGLEVGSLWKNIEDGSVESALLSISSDVGWISIDRRGFVAVVKARQKIDYPEEEVHLYSNIVADRDCIIEQITVKQGVATVKAGDAVKQGQILISGVVETGGATVFCEAQGSVIGRALGECYEEVSRFETVNTELSRKLKSKQIIIFNFAINIFKNSRNFGDDCAIIDEKNNFLLFGRYSLPIWTVDSIAVLSDSIEVEHTDAELVRLAKDRLIDKRAQLLSDSELISLSTVGFFTDEGYRVSCEFVYLTEIGQERLISSVGQ